MWPKNSLIISRNLLLPTPHHLHFPEELVAISHSLPQISCSTCIKWFFDRRSREKRQTWFRRQTPSVILFFLFTVWEHYKLLLFKALWFVRLSWIFAWRVYQKHHDTLSWCWSQLTAFIIPRQRFECHARVSGETIIPSNLRIHQRLIFWISLKMEAQSLVVCVGCIMDVVRPTQERVFRYWMI